MTKSPVKHVNKSSLDRLELASTGPEQTQAIAAAFADVVQIGDLLVLSGHLGAGKTCFTQGLGRSLGIEQRITSPTFTLANQYQGRLLLHHLDVYRLDSVTETLDLDLPDLFESGVTVIEWGEQINDVLPDEHLLVSFCYPDIGPTGAVTSSNDGTGPAVEAAGGYDRRVIEIVATGERWQQRLASVALELCS